MCTPITHPKIFVGLSLNTCSLLQTQAGTCFRTGCFKNWAEDSWILHNVSQHFEAHISAPQSLLSLTLATGTDCEIVTVHCWLGWSALGQAVIVSNPGSSGAEMPKGTQELTHSPGTGCVPTWSTKLKWGHFPMTWKCVSDRNQVEMTAMWLTIFTIYSIFCIYYLPPSPALWLLIHFYQEPFSHANEVL